ncbi:MAG: NAD(P)-dependent oxidoreductase [Chitinophagaceae bacterium]
MYNTRIGLIREGKTPPDTRVALTPLQCVELMHEYPGLKIVVQPSPIRCFKDSEYEAQGITLQEDLSDCNILLGIKEVPIANLMEGKTYFFFSHTKKAQAYNKPLMQALIAKRIRMIDYECLTHADGQRILGFGFFAGLVGAHNGLLTYGKRTEAFTLPAANYIGCMAGLQAIYDDLVLPPIRIVVTGSGKVAAGIVEIMNDFDVDFIEPEDFLEFDYDYPVYTHLKGASLYVRKDGKAYHRDDFHKNPQAYQCVFSPYLKRTDILLNGIYWDKDVPRLFEKEEIQAPDFRMFVISDITCDVNGSVPINLGASTIDNPVYGVNRFSFQRTEPFLKDDDIIDLMAVDNLPNELPRDASTHFGIHIQKYVLKELLKDEVSDILKRATICRDGKLLPDYEYLSEYAYGA